MHRQLKGSTKYNMINIETNRVTETSSKYMYMGFSSYCLGQEKKKIVARGIITSVGKRYSFDLVYIHYILWHFQVTTLCVIVASQLHAK